MEKTKKLTKIEMFEMIKTRLVNSDEIAFIDREIELIRNKNANRKPTASQKENEKFKEIIAIFLHENENEKFTIAQLQENVSEVSTLSNQRMTHILNQMVDVKEIFKTYEKRKAYFSVTEM